MIVFKPVYHQTMTLSGSAVDWFIHWLQMKTIWTYS